MTQPKAYGQLHCHAEKHVVVAAVEASVSAHCLAPVVVQAWEKLCLVESRWRAKVMPMAAASPSLREAVEVLVLLRALQVAKELNRKAARSGESDWTRS